MQFPDEAGSALWPNSVFAGRRHRRAERRVVHDATDLAGLPAERNLLELPADVLALRRQERRAEDVGADELLLNRLAVDLVRDQRLQDVRALRVADQHHAAALVVVLQVVLPRIADVVVLNALAEQRQRIRIRSRAPPAGRAA